MADWSLPTLSSTYTNFLSQLQARDTDLALGFDGTTSSNLTTGTIRWDSTANRWKKWNGSSWAELTSTYALTGLSTTGNATIAGTFSVTGQTTLALATATTPATADNNTNIATTAFVKAQGYAPLASPTFTGTVTIPSGASIAGYLTTTAAAAAYAPLASPVLTGTPAAPTAAASTNTTQIATTAFVLGQASSTAPAMNGTAAVGTVTTFARADHVHASDTSRAPLASPTFTGTVTIPAGASISGFAPLASPTFTGTPSVPSLNGGPIAGTRNRIINGAVAIDQRNAGAAQTFTAAAALAYSVDRWYGYCTGANVTGQRVQGATVGQYRYQFTGAASVTAIGFGHRIEQLNSADLASSTATLSVDLASSLLTTVTWTAYYATTADTFGTLASPTRTQIATGTFTVTSTVTRYSTNISVPAAATTGMEIVFTVGAQTSGTWTIGNVQVEPGTVATPFERRSYGQELALCQRYFETSYPTGTAVGGASDATGSLMNVAINGGDFYTFGSFRFSVKKRASPTVLYYNPVTGTVTQFRGVSDGSNGAVVSTSYINDAGVGNVRCSPSILTTNYVYAFHYAASAEL